MNRITLLAGFLGFSSMACMVEYGTKLGLNESADAGTSTTAASDRPSEDAGAVIPSKPDAGLESDAALADAAVSPADASATCFMAVKGVVNVLPSGTREFCGVLATGSDRDTFTIAVAAGSPLLGKPVRLFADKPNPLGPQLRVQSPSGSDSDDTKVVNEWDGPGTYTFTVDRAKEANVAYRVSIDR